MPDLTGLQSLQRISLPEVLASAPATTRVDRKYLVPLERGEHFLAQLPASLRLLSINGRLTTSYRSTYFDTADLLTCRAHIQGRRRRWKARSRLYVEDGLCRLELKVRDGSGLTRKFFHPTKSDAYGEMNGVALGVLPSQLRTHGHTRRSSSNRPWRSATSAPHSPTQEPAPASPSTRDPRHPPEIRRSRWTRATSSSRPKVAVPPVWRTRSSSTSARAPSR